MDSGAWRTAVHGVTESDTTEAIITHAPLETKLEASEF